MICKLCSRDLDCQDHHLIPKMVNSRKIMQKMATNGKVKDTSPLCEACHYQIHKLFTEKELALKYNTIEKLQSQPSVQKWIAWISKKPIDFIPPK